jgi:unsaturated chondroitin disaccharide hydrolase
MNQQTAARREALLPLFRGALDFAAVQTRRVLTEHPGYYPMYTVAGKWGKEPELWTHWCEGFYPGICWLLHKHTGDAEWRQAAAELSLKLESRKHDRNVHDLGFLFFSTYLRWYHLTSDPKLRDVLIEAGRTLALRRQKGGYLASFIGPQSLFIDIMMNVGIIFWAANAAGDESLRNVALEHCRTTAQYIVRPHGGTAHEGLFDVGTGKFKRESTHQGWRSESTWSRGLAWAIYGFTAAHRLSGEAEYLDVARRCAGYYLKHSPPGLVPYWDYDAPVDSPPLWDSSAGAITASGLWDLAEATPNAAEREQYQAAALTILQTLCADAFLARSKPGWEGILLHGVYHKNKGIGVDESVAWGDHFFVEALVKAVAGRSDVAW